MGFRKRFLKFRSILFCNLHLIKNGNIKLAEEITDSINVNNSIPNSGLLILKCFSAAANFNFNPNDFPPLRSNRTVFKSTRSCKPIITSNVCYSDPVSNVNKCYSKPVPSSNVQRSKPVYSFSNVYHSKPVPSCNVHRSKPVSSCNVHRSKPVTSSNVNSSKDRK